MASTPINIYAACGQRKRASCAVFRLDEVAPYIPGEPPEKRLNRWERITWTQKNAKLSFEQTYLGGFWGALRACSKNEDIRVFAVSAGFGLLAPGTKIPNYDATFSPRVENSINKGCLSSVTEANQSWWKMISDIRRLAGSPGSIQDEVRHSNCINIVALPQLYLEAVWNDISTILDDPKLRNKIIVLTTPYAKTITSSDRVIRIPSGIRAELGGTIGTILPRLALKIAQELGANCREPTLVQSLVKSLRQESELSPKRDKQTDSEIIKFIKKFKKETPSAIGYTSSLRKFRGSGLACEMKRFRALYNKIN